MKKIVSIMLVLALAIAMLTTVVNAASLSVDKTEVKEGDTVVVTVPVGNVQNFGIKLSYDKDAFDYVSKDSGEFTGAVNDKKDEGVVVYNDANQAAGNTTEIKFTFTAKKAVKDAAFEVTSYKAGTGDSRVTSLDNSKVTVTVTEKAEEPVTPVNPTENNTTTEDNKKEETTNTTKNDGKKVLPQTGAPVYAYALATVAAIAVVGLAVRKNK